MFLTAMSQQFSFLAKNGMVASSQPLATLGAAEAHERRSPQSIRVYKNPFTLSCDSI
jgi:hypothetical protein